MCNDARRYVGTGYGGCFRDGGVVLGEGLVLRCIGVQVVELPQVGDAVSQGTDGEVLRRERL